MEKALFGAGCFWGVEDFFRQVPGVSEAVSGYAGGTTDHPTYKQICNGDTYHAEVVEYVVDTVFDITKEQVLVAGGMGIGGPEGFAKLEELAHALGGASAVLLKNHGATFVGASIKEATLAGVFLERAARVQLALAGSGIPHHHSGADEIRQKKQTIYPPRAVDNFWRYYNRKLDRMEGARR